MFLSISFMESKMHATVKEYRGILIVELLVKGSIAGEVLTSLDQKNFRGHIVMDTENNLGASLESLTLLDRLLRTPDGRSVDWRTSNGASTFCWAGPPKRVFDPSTTETNDQFEIGKHISIPNKVSKEIKGAIDRMLEVSETFMYS